MSAIPSSHPHIVLVRSRVRYLGRAAPSEHTDRHAAIQKPLCELYHFAATQAPFDTVLTVYNDGVAVESPELANGKWWAIQDLVECGAFKAVDNPLTFLPLTSPEVKHLAPSGPVFFAMTFRRRDIPTAG